MGDVSLKCRSAPAKKKRGKERKILDCSAVSRQFDETGWGGGTAFLKLTSPARGVEYVTGKSLP